MANRFFTTESFKNAVLNYQSEGKTVVEVERCLADAKNPRFYGRTQNGKTVAMQSLNIENFSEVVPTFEIRSYNGGEYMGAIVRGFSLHIIGTDNYYFISWDRNDKMTLKTWADIDTDYNKLKYFKTELVEPKHIGTATVRKVTEWAEYANAYTTEILNYINANECRIEEQMQHAAKCEGAKVERDNTGKITRVGVPVGGAMIYFTRGEKSVNYNYSINFAVCNEFAEAVCKMQ